MKKILVLLFSMFILSCSKEKDENILILGTNDMFPPFAYLNGDEVVGFDIELAKEIAKDIGKTLVIKTMDFDELWDALQDNEIDMAIRAITITDDRNTYLDFSKPYYKTSQAVIIRKDDKTFNNIHTKEELGQNKTIAVEHASTGSDTAKKIANDETSIVERNSLEFVLLELISKNVDAVIVDSKTAQSFITEYDNLAIVPIEFEAEHYGVAVKKGNDELAKSINKTLDRIINSGEYLTLVEENIHAYLLK